jgi:hypothetical protein
MIYEFQKRLTCVDIEEILGLERGDIEKIETDFLGNVKIHIYEKAEFTATQADKLQEIFPQHRMKQVE